MSAVAGYNITVLAGPGVPRPLPAECIAVLERVEVTEVSGGRSGFQLMFGAGRGNPPDRVDYPLLARQLLAPFTRVVIIVTLSGVPTVLMDGFITHQELFPDNGGPQASLTVTGEDVSVMMDLEAKTALHPGLSDSVTATRILAKYLRYGVVPVVRSASGMEVPSPLQRVPAQHGTDLQHLRLMASRYGFLFHITPGPLPLANQAYFGPTPVSGGAQPALTVASESLTNVESITFTNDALESATVNGVIQEPLRNRKQAVSVRSSTLSSLSRRPAITANRPNVRRDLLPYRGGLDAAQYRALGQGLTNLASLRTVHARTELNTLSYGKVVRAKQPIGVRGAGATFDGTFYVQEASHSLRRGSYRQQLTLIREGTGAKLPLVNV